ncbi:MAG TPA: hypothetical protein VF765_24550 [Polyangiaceae bacterium]
MTRWLCALALLAAACSKPSETTDAKRSPKPPPPVASGVAIPTAVHLDVEIDGAPGTAIDATRLGASKPDFVDDDHRAWRIAALVGPAASRPGAVVAAVSDKGLSLDMPAPNGPKDPVPALSLNRRGEVVVGLVAPDDPFPDYHGRGGRLSRPGDPLPHLAAPTKLRVYVPAAAPVASSTPP